MASNLAFEATIRDDLRTMLTTAGLANFKGYSVYDGPYPAVAVAVDDARHNAQIDSGTLPLGNWTANVRLDCVAYVEDDETGVLLDAYARRLRTAILVDDLISTLNAASYYVTYIATHDWAARQFGDSGFRVLSTTFTMEFRPGNSTSTTTTSTTSTSTTTSTTTAA